MIYRHNFTDISSQTFGDGIDSSGVISLYISLSFSSIEQTAISFVATRLGISSPMGVTYTSGYRTGKMTYAYVQQTDVSVLVNEFAAAH